MDGPFIIDDHSGVSSFHVFLSSSPPLFSLVKFYPLNQDDENFVISLRESSTALKEEGLLTTQSKLGVKKRNYDAIRKFQDSWVLKPPWVELCVGSNGDLHTIKSRICSEVEGKYSLFPKWGSFYKHVSDKKVEKEY
jgi:hypothetical protein